MTARSQPPARPAPSTARPRRAPAADSGPPAEGVHAGPRATTPVRAGRVRAVEIAARLGQALREARRAAGLTQGAAAARARVSQQRWSDLERGQGASSTIATLANCAAAIGERLVVFVEHESGASLPRDIQHLRRQEVVVSAARHGGWTCRPEAAVAGDRPRSIDVLLIRDHRREAAVVEIWDLLTDVGGALRATDLKVAAVRRRLPRYRVSACWVIRGTRRNRDLLRSIPSLVEARFPATSGDWLAALTDVNHAMPDADGIVWTDATGGRLAPPT